MYLPLKHLVIIWNSSGFYNRRQGSRAPEVSPCRCCSQPDRCLMITEICTTWVQFGTKVSRSHDRSSFLCARGGRSIEWTQVLPSSESSQDYLMCLDFTKAGHFALLVRELPLNDTCTHASSHMYSLGQKTAEHAVAVILHPCDTPAADSYREWRQLLFSARLHQASGHKTFVPDST